MMMTIQKNNFLLNFCEPSAVVELTCPESGKKGAKMMTTQKLKALVNTVIKQSTLDSSQITDPTQKFSLITNLQPITTGN
jgi:gamma-glutamylcysteine synthetase